MMGYLDRVKELATPSHRSPIRTVVTPSNSTAAINEVIHKAMSDIRQNAKDRFDGNLERAYAEYISRSILGALSKEKLRQALGLK